MRWGARGLRTSVGSPSELLALPRPCRCLPRIGRPGACIVHGLLCIRLLKMMELTRLVGVARIWLRIEVGTTKHSTFRDIYIIKINMCLLDFFGNRSCKPITLLDNPLGKVGLIWLDSYFGYTVRGRIELGVSLIDLLRADTSNLVEQLIL